MLEGEKKLSPTSTSNVAEAGWVVGGADVVVVVGGAEVVVVVGASVAVGAGARLVVVTAAVVVVGGSTVVVVAEVVVVVGDGGLVVALLAGSVVSPTVSSVVVAGDRVVGGVSRPSVVSAPPTGAVLHATATRANAPHKIRCLTFVASVPARCRHIRHPRGRL